MCIASIVLHYNGLPNKNQIQAGWRPAASTAWRGSDKAGRQGMEI